MRASKDSKLPLSALTRRFRPSRPPSAWAPEGVRIYAVGDLHGRSDLLDEAAAAIEKDVASAQTSVVTVLLGDYVDRGPKSAEVVDRLARADFPTPIRALRGNHEAMLLRFLEDASQMESWREYGGLETLCSYGVDVTKAMRGEGYDEAREALLAALPAVHRSFLESTELSVAYGDYFFCHAGVRPGLPLDRQRAQDLLWIRESFLSFDRSFGKVIVHGHTPVETPDVRENRINLDTGAFATSRLACLVLEGAERRLLLVGAWEARGLSAQDEQQG